VTANWAYILTNRERGSFYHGSTHQPALRLEEHRSGRGSKHVWKYNLLELVWFQICDDKEEALLLEHRMKRKNRARKVRIIEALNPDWRDLTAELLEEARREWL
jgi:putative endonuclease